MTGLLERIGGPVLRAIDPERAHDLAIAVLRTGLVNRRPSPDDERLRVRLWNLDFRNPVGMAAGFDKNGDVPDALLGLGFGFVEIGTVAPRPQPGNPKPRVFRLSADEAAINRYGFNTKGQDAVTANLARRDRRRSGILGINIGANKDSEDRTADYVAGVAAFAEHADYLAVNISSPNTPGLRDLHHDLALEDLLARVSAERDRQTAATGRRVPLLLKIAPDLEDADLDAIAGAYGRHRFEGLIVSNTTLSRSGLADPQASEAGGLSGRPLFRRSTIILARLRQRVGPGVPLIGVGGIDSGATAYEKIRAGACLVQVYTGLVFKGPGLVDTIKRDLLEALRRDGLSSISDAVGTGTDDWARQDIG
ncbi:quinone-dependent dihydroorotate dehydrogenase [Microbaculum marinum]|uniref:Dihydroorotate dehydrogenase (quinone) n=1 Tax=Microbaculum marinum TaxID=1764581 RepID=A0AAW9RQL4_9HYPH